MGKIINSKVSQDNRIVYRILLDKNETISLKNAIKNINLFSADLCNKETAMIKKGKKGVTQFFEIPFILRFRKRKEHEKIFYQKLELPSKIFYIYTINKNRLMI